MLFGGSWVAPHCCWGMPRLAGKSWVAPYCCWVLWVGCCPVGVHGGEGAALQALSHLRPDLGRWGSGRGARESWVEQDAVGRPGLGVGLLGCDIVAAAVAVGWQPVCLRVEGVVEQGGWVGPYGEWGHRSMVRVGGVQTGGREAVGMGVADAVHVHARLLEIVVVMAAAVAAATHMQAQLLGVVVIMAAATHMLAQPFGVVVAEFDGGGGGAAATHTQARLLERVVAESAVAVAVAEVKCALLVQGGCACGKLLPAAAASAAEEGSCALLVKGGCACTPLPPASAVRIRGAQFACCWG
mmetsp:Transcript_15984/g.43550  ORF Transcript_15984/g.43550 Transcript_15984/m.43550 type:complete len:298 (+) Transcript_15984:747-1640(+)